MTIYIDIVFIENIIINYIILVATALISKIKIRHVPIFLSSILGGLYSILNYIIPLSLFENIVFKLILSFVMIKIAFYSLNLKRFFKTIIMFYLTSFTFGGASFMLLFLVSPENIIYENGHFIGTYPIKVAIIGGTLGFLIIFIVSKIIKNRLESSNLLCELEIFYNGKNNKIKTLIDTGNLLKEPISKEDVIIVEKESLREFIDDKVFREIKNIMNGNLIGEVSEELYKYKFKVIPFASLGNENGVLIGFKPDYIKIYSPEEDVVKNNVLIGIYDGKLSKTNLYTSLVGVNILKEGNKNEFSTIA